MAAKRDLSHEEQLKYNVESGVISTASVDRDKPRMNKQQVKDFAERAAAYDSEMITGIFRNLQHPGGGTRFFHRTYATEQKTTYEFFDGKVYRIPRGIYRFLLNQAYVPQYNYLEGADKVMGTPEIHKVASGRTQQPGNGLYERNVGFIEQGARRHRFSFSPLEFGLNEDINKVFDPQEQRMFPNIMTA